jgi:DNA-directed RNA polymerase subunit RPC12/RpoP
MVRCPTCAEPVRTADEDAGKATVCPQCGSEIPSTSIAAGEPSRAPKANKAYCPFCSAKFRTAKQDGEQVRCPGCKCKFKLPVSTDTDAIDLAPEPSDAGPDPARKAFMDDLDRQNAEKTNWRNWNEERRKRDVFFGSTEDDSGWSRFGWIGYLLWLLFR